MANFKEKVKGFFQNRAAVIVTTLIILTLATAITLTVVLNRAKKPSTNLPTDETNAISETTTKATDTKTAKTIDETGEAVKYNSGETAADAKKDEPTVDVAETKFVLPVSGTLAKEHDASIQVWSATTGDYRVHLGIDIASDENAPVSAAAAGTVSKIWNDPMMGVCVAITHDNDTCTVYKNLSSNLADGIKEGAAVTCGQTIGNIGDSAVLELADEPHLHFEMTVNGLTVDPLQYLDSESVATLTTDTAYEDETTVKADEKMTEYTEETTKAVTK